MTKLTMKTVTCCVKVQAEMSHKRQTTSGVRQGDALTCLLFNIALEKAVRECKIQANQLLAYADDSEIVGNSIHRIQGSGKRSQKYETKNKRAENKIHDREKQGEWSTTVALDH